MPSHPNAESPLLPPRERRRYRDFLETLNDLEKSTNELHEYTLIRTSGLLRKLLFDSDPLIHQINRRFKLRIEFSIHNDSYLQLIKQMFKHASRGALFCQCDGLAWSPSGQGIVKKSLQEFLGYEFLCFENNWFTVKEVVQYFAYCEGGVHPVKLSNSREALLAQLIETARTRANLPQAVYELKGINLVVLEALAPLRRRVAQELQTTSHSSKKLNQAVASSRPTKSDVVAEQLNVNELYKRAYAHWSQGNLELAISDYTRVLEMQDVPINARISALNSRGILYCLSEKFQSAIVEFSKILEMTGADSVAKAQALLNRGRANHKLGNLEPAKSDYSAVLEVRDIDPSASALALMKRGSVHEDQNDMVLALADYSAVEAMQGIPDDLRAHGRRAVSRLKPDTSPT